MGTISRSDSWNGFQFCHSNLASDCSGYDQRFGEIQMPGIMNVSSQNQVNPNLRRGDEDPVPDDYFGGVYDYIREMLMEEDDLEHRPCMFQDCSALQAAEKYFHDALRPAPPPTRPLSVPDFSITESDFPSWSTHGIREIGGGPATFSFNFDGFVDSPAESNFQLLNSSATSRSRIDNNGVSLFQISDGNNPQVIAGEGRGNRSDEDRRTRKNRDGEETGEERSSKQFASNGDDDESVEMNKHDKSLLCSTMNPQFYKQTPPSDSDDSPDEEAKKQYRKTREVKRGRPKGSKKNRAVAEVVDLSSLLTRCAEAVSSFNIVSAEKLLKQIRSHCSPYGDPNERLAHYFANALEARVSGTGSALYTSSAARRIPASELLKSYQAYVTACPFKRMTNIFANKSIGRFTREAMKIHIIDFGILYGFQWPCIIQGISLRPGGPPMLKITGIDFPQPGFKPAERVEQTGKRLVNYCKRFNVPFEYSAIAKRWDEISVEDLKIEKDEMVVVNCLYRLRHVPDESAGVDSPRDAVLKLIKKINPSLFVHGVVNGAYNAPFFATRFREVQFHYSSFFDMMEATLPREDQDRLMYEREVFGRDVMNVIACEGLERIERPETYKQWQVRNQRAGFKQIPLYREIMKEVKAKVRTDYHNDFLVDEDSGWMLQGWKGRVMYALSFWRLSE